jgi:hypothetical protein
MGSFTLESSIRGDASNAPIAATSQWYAKLGLKRWVTSMVSEVKNKRRMERASSILGHSRSIR